MPSALLALPARAPLARVLRPVLAVLLVALGVVVPATAAHADTPGGTSRATAVPLPVADLDSSFTASNAHISTARGTDGQTWNNVTWYSWTPSATVNVYIRATSTNPSGWDNTLEVWSDGGQLAQNDDSYGLDAALRVTLQAGVRYTIGMGGFWSGAKGAATLTFATRVPSAPQNVAVESRDGALGVTWQPPADVAGGVTSYTVRCGPEGGALTTCATVYGTPPTTSTVLSGRTNGTTYAVEVVASNIIGPSDPSATVTGTPKALTTTTVTTDPAAPVSGEPFDVVVRVAGASTGTVDLSLGGSDHTLDLVDGAAVLEDVVRTAGTLPVSAAFSGTTSARSSSTSGEVVVAKRPQTVTVEDLPEGLVYAGEPVELSATSSEDRPVTFTAGGACAVRNGTMLHLVDVGTCTVTATGAGDSETLVGEAQVSAEVGRRAQTLVLASLPALVYGQDPAELTAASSVGLPVTLTGEGACEVVDGALAVVGVGGCTVTATQEGDEHTAAAEPVVRTTHVAKREQTVTIDAFDAPALGTPTADVTASSELGLPVTLDADGACAFDDDGALHALTAGECTVTAEAEGDDVTLAGSATSTVDVADVDTDVSAGMHAELGDEVAGTRVAGTGIGLLPGSTLTLTVHSTPQVLGTAEVALDGTARIDGVLPADLESGEHRLVVDGVAFDGETVESEMRFGVGRDGTFVLLGDERAVTALPGVPVALAATGASGALQALGTVGAVAVALGAGLVLLRRVRVRCFRRSSVGSSTRPRFRAVVRWTFRGDPEMLRLVGRGGRAPTSRVPSVSNPVRPGRTPPGDGTPAPQVCVDPVDRHHTVRPSTNDGELPRWRD